MADSLLTTAVASLLTVVFVVAAAGKTQRAAFESFCLSVAALWPGRRRLGRASRRVLAGGLLAIEILMACATVLISASAVFLGTTSRSRVPTFAAAAILLGAFSVAHAVALARHVSGPCACFGRTTDDLGAAGLLRTAVLAALSVGAALASAIGPTGTGDAAPLASAVAVLAGGAMGLLIVALEEIVALFRVVPSPTTRVSNHG